MRCSICRFGFSVVLYSVTRGQCQIDIQCLGHPTPIHLASSIPTRAPSTHALGDSSGPVRLFMQTVRTYYVRSGSILMPNVASFAETSDIVDLK